MTAPVTAPRPRVAPSGPTRVLVVLRGGRGRDIELGDAPRARRDRRLTAAERAAIATLERAVRLLHERVGLAGLDDAGEAVRLVLRDKDATSGGPWATTGAVAVGTRNALASRSGAHGRPGMLLTVDSAVHELVHAVQFGTMSDSATPHGAILEGVADAAAILATGDDTLGEKFFATGRDGRPLGAIRELGTPRIAGVPLGPTIRRYRDAIAKDAEVHAAGGVVSETFIELRRLLGREQAEALLWRVIRDRNAWSTGGSWALLAAALVRAGDAMVVAGAVHAALRVTGLDAALPTAA
jgi:hypothetical protein